MSKIQWTEATWNPTTGCDRVTPGCDHCYALTMAPRLKAMGSAKYQNDGDPKTSGPGFGITEHPDTLTEPLGWRKPRKVFVNSMSDLFHEGVTDEFIALVWQTMGAAPHHTYQILTKRHARLRSWTNRWYSGEIAEPWRVADVPEYPGYRVTTTGKVLGRRGDTRDGLSEDVGELGHRRVTMYREGSPPSGERELVHRLVLAAFVRPPRRGEQACHRNGNANDNRLSNLYWGTQETNWRDRAQHGNRRSYVKLDLEQVAEIRRRCSAGESAYAVARDFPVSDTQVRNIIRGDQWGPEPPEFEFTSLARAVLPCVWLGVSVEDQKRAELRIPALIGTPAAVRFLSCEPLLGPLALSGFGLSDLHWVILGGESGRGARPMDPGWVRDVIEQCHDRGVATFVKQLGAVWAQDTWRAGECVAKSDPKGGNPDAWPRGLNVREYPVVQP